MMTTEYYFPCLENFCILSLLFTFKAISHCADASDIELNRERGDLIQPNSLRNLKVFELGAEFQSANYTIVKEEPSSVSLKEKTLPVCPALSCRDLQVDLSRSAAEFIQCAVLNARPITVCLSCVASYNSTVHSYQQIMEASENATMCRDVLFGQDKLEITQTMYENVLNLWNDANCDTCYGTKNGAPDLSVVSNMTLNFFEILIQVRDCFEDIRSFDKIVDDTSNDTCSQCRSPYERLNGAYASIVTELINNQPTEQVCADIADAINVTRHLWSNQFKCKVFGTELGYAMFVLTGSLFSLPILFYLAAKILSNAETIHLVLPKRKFQDST